MLTGRERDEVKLMAVVVALYYVQYMLRAKDTARLEVIFVDRSSDDSFLLCSAPPFCLAQISQLDDLRDVRSYHQVP